METIVYSQDQLDLALMLGQITEEEYYEELIRELLVELWCLENPLSVTA